MARRFIPLDNLTQIGINNDIPSTGRLWNTLHNIVRGSEGWKRRPGINRLDNGALPSITIGDPKLIINFKHPASKPLSETLRPTGTGTYNSWTANGAATAWQAVDEVIADDDTTDITASALDTKVSFTFPNLSSTFIGISSVRVHFRIELSSTINHLIRIATRISGTDYDLGEITVSSGSGWKDVSFSISQNPKTLAAWTSAEIDALEIIFIKGDSSSTTIFIVSQTESQTATASSTTGLSSVGQGGTISFPISALTWNTVDAVTLPIRFRASITSGINAPDFGYTVEVKLNNVTVGQASVGFATGIQSVINTTLSLPGITTGGGSLVVSITGKTGDTSISGGSVGVTVNGSLFRQGNKQVTTSSSIPAKITQVYVKAEGDGANARRNSLIMATDSAFLRIDEAFNTYSDIIGTASPPTASTGIAWDSTTFLDKIYIVNGTDQIFHYPSAGDSFEQLSNQPTGAAIASFASRLMLGDITELGVRLPSRLRWSAINDATNWTDATSGNLELDETDGKIVAMLPLVELSESLVGVLAVYKNTGIYHIKSTGTSSEPFERKLMNSSAGCIARGSVVGISDDTGTDAHVFLGQIGGSIDVLSWNGRNIQRLGAPVVPIIREFGDSINIEKSQATIDTNGNYILLFPTTNSSFLSLAVIYNFVHKVWSTWTVGESTAIGRWTPVGLPVSTILGRPDSIAYRFDDTISTDDTVTEDNNPIVSIMSTGNLALMAPELERRGTLESIWVYYREDTNSTIADVSVSTDGGHLFRADETNASKEVVFSGGNKQLLLQRIPVRVNGRKHQVKFIFAKDDGNTEIVQILLEVEDGGVQAK